MKTRTATSIKLKTSFNGLVDITVPKGADVKNLITNILLASPVEDIEDVLSFINDLAEEIKQNRLIETGE